MATLWLQCNWVLPAADCCWFSFCGANECCLDTFLQCKWMLPATYLLLLEFLLLFLWGSSWFWELHFPMLLLLSWCLKFLPIIACFSLSWCFSLSSAALTPLLLSWLLLGFGPASKLVSLLIHAVPAQHIVSLKSSWGLSCSWVEALGVHHGKDLLPLPCLWAWSVQAVAWIGLPRKWCSPALLVGLSDFLGTLASMTWRGHSSSCTKITWLWWLEGKRGWLGLSDKKK